MHVLLLPFILISSRKSSQELIFYYNTYILDILNRDYAVMPDMSSVCEAYQNQGKILSSFIRRVWVFSIPTTSSLFLWM